MPTFSANANRDQNRVPNIQGVSKLDGATLVNIATDPTTGHVQVDADITLDDATISTKTPLTASSPTFATVGVTSALALASNTNRKGLILVNSSVNTISVGIGVAAVLNSGITLYPGGTFEMDEYCFATGAVNAIASAASSNLTIQEFTT